ncbi:MAG: rane dipeptidase [Blastocatellia bacterium]
MFAPFALKVSALLCFASLLAGPAVSRDGKNKIESTSQKQTAASSPTKPDDAALRARADKLHREAIVIDTHNDITSPMVDDNFDLATSGINADGTMKTHTDIGRMKEGGLDAEFFAIYVGKEFVGKKHAEGGGAARRALDMIDAVREQVRRHPETFEMASTAADIRRIAKRGKIAALMGIEGGHAIEDSLRALRSFYALGIRYMTLTHTNTNDWADSSGDINNAEVKHHNGLTDFGHEVVREMNRIGMMVDISHVADKTFYDVIETSRAPIIASHSSARALASHARNMDDDMLRAIGKQGGVVMVNFYDGFLDPRKVEFNKTANAKAEELRKQYPDDAKRGEEEFNKWLAANAPARTPLSLLIDHIDHIAKVAGMDHVGIGSDFDGIPLTGAPAGMEDISKLPNITIELMKRGYTDADIKKVLGENFLRVMAEVERVAGQMQAKEPNAATQKFRP